MPGRAQTSGEILESYGISFETKTLHKDKRRQLNRQSRLLVEYLLDFRNTLTKEDNDDLAEPYLETCCEVIRSPTIQERRNQHAKEEYRKNFDIANCEAKVDLAYSIAKAANAIISEEENRWTNVIVHLLFGTLHKAALEVERPNCHRSVKDAIGKIRTDCDRLWTLGSHILKEKAQLSEKHLKITDPKPDLCLSFHAYTQEREDGGPMHADSYMTNFSKDSLTQLYNLYEQNNEVTFKPYSSPFGRFYKPEKRQYCDQSCFPWAICEWKQVVDPEKPNTAVHNTLDLQIARAGAVAATIFANLTAGWTGEPILDNIRPVVCFSFVGPRVKVYVVSISNVSHGRYKYIQCIWSGKLFNVLHNVELCWIIERLHRWAIHHLRPWLSSCIDAWNFREYPRIQYALQSSDQPQRFLEEQAKSKMTTQKEDESEKDGSEEVEVGKKSRKQVKKVNAGKAGAKRDSSEDEVDDQWEPREFKRQSTAASFISGIARSATKLAKGGRNSKRGSRANI